MVLFYIAPHEKCRFLIRYIYILQGLCLGGEMGRSGCVNIFWFQELVNFFTFSIPKVRINKTSNQQKPANKKKLVSLTSELLHIITQFILPLFQFYSTVYCLLLGFNNFLLREYHKNHYQKEYYTQYNDIATMITWTLVFIFIPPQISSFIFIIS